MPISIQPYTEDKIAAVRAFNARLAAGGIAPEFHFPEHPVPHWLPKKDDRHIYQEYFLAIDDEFVRGGFILKYQEFLLGGKTQVLAYYHLPVSEGIVNRKFAGIGVHMLRSAMKMQPTLFALGMGGFDRPLPTMLKALRWEMAMVPFFFQVNHPSRFLRQIAPFRSSSARRAAAGLAAFTGAGWLGIKALQRIHSRDIPGTSIEVIPSFGSWADDLWQRCSGSYALIAKRDSATLNILYPGGKSFVCLRVAGADRIAGWAVVLDTQMRNNKYFGNLRVGSIADCLAAPEDAPAVVGAAARALQTRGADLVIANHSHPAWRQAFRSAGFLEGPSNFIFAAAPALAEKLQPFDSKQLDAYLNRGDGDGPVNL
jgi:hypothetical protein